ncbi:MAG: hypothetical protein PPFGHCPK_01333 [Spiroplasma endosymbiont of Drosophila atripex]|nr:MAG: hypothetical protein PPFGHCPK_00023 [Spiroplasma endosymbiont of Drosophila atripex]WDA53878.1 MAG: hypothetical protein PPFGHCPK_00292 [Spiroplasma endosymbiont of Drosophila atripex]WDA54612.1 MAG: hypothetical protein PPFGHCPK_01068 [Spiroplasma endosymbiont of Drosophila atripex]WDA54852.1 MAG: hypothetical protein PPFGHCPK_01333 [Spiroplasma endosymbiont of Drosophila atripex]
MINKLWTDVSLENYNNWYPLTGKIIETPQQYIKTWPNANDWFKTFAIRAQNDINAYLDFILSKFPFDSFKDELIKETLRDMVYVMVEHWVFNRTPIEFNVDATIQFNNGSQFSASSIPTINVWDLAPSRMKIWARLTELKQVFQNYNQDEIDVEKIDLKVFYTRNQVDDLIKEQKEFTLSKQIKLYDDLVDDNINEIYRGRVTNFINKGYVATEYDPKTETMILDWPDEIGTLPPEVLQNNPQVGDFTHAPTCDFSAKQQKRITANENTITKLNSKLSKTNESIDDIKNNWFNIETSPLWKKMSSFIPSGEFSKTYLAIWGYIYQPPSTPIDNYIYSDKKTIFNLGGDINRTTQTSIKLDELIIKDNVKVQLLFTKEWNDITVVSNDINYQAGSVTLYQYIGKGKPNEFIAEDSTERDYYTKIETNNLLDKKQEKLIVGENIKIDENNKISAIGGSTDLSDYYKKEEVNKKLEDKIDKEHFSYAFTVNTIGTEISNLETTNKTVVGAINELLDKKQNKIIWKKVGTKVSDTQINYNFIINNTYKVNYTWGKNDTAIMYKYFTWTGISTILETIYVDEDTYTQLHVSSSNKAYIVTSSELKGVLISLEETNQKDFFNIEFKVEPIPPTPCPYPKWIEVGTREKNKWDNWQITYDFIENKRYRVYYSWNIYNPVYAIQEFIITDDRIAGVEIEVFNNNSNVLVLSVNHAKFITIYSLKGSYKGNTWKLEELQE